MKESVCLIPESDGLLASQFEFGVGEMNILRDAGRWLRRQQKKSSGYVSGFVEQLAEGQITGVGWRGKEEDVINLCSLREIVSEYAEHRRNRFLARIPFNRAAAHEDAELAEAMAEQFRAKAEEVLDYLPPQTTGGVHES